MLSGILSGCLGMSLSPLAVIRIMPHTTYPGVRPCPDRVIGLAIPRTAPAADQMAGHLRYRHVLRQPQDFGIEIQVPLWPAVGAMHLQQFVVPDRVANRHRLGAELLRLATAPRLVPIPLKLDQLGEAG